MKLLNNLTLNCIPCALSLCLLSNFTFAVDCKGLPAWNADDVYTAGKQVQHSAIKYEAKWWTQGDNPTQSGQWDVWRNLGNCGAVVISSSRSSIASSRSSSSLPSSTLSIKSSLISFSRSSSSIVASSSVAATGGRAAAIPVGIENVNDSPMKAAGYRSLLRFVPLNTINIDRFYFGFKLRGANCYDAGLAGYGRGDGGLLRGSLVEINQATGLPSTEIASETINACTRYNQAKTEFGGANPVLVWTNARATLEAGKMYGFIVSNAHTDPQNNFFSFNAPLADTSLAGPHTRNELNPNAKGAILSLDPREHIAWSEDSGISWRYGSLNGQYRSYMNDRDTAHPATRMPQYGFRLTNNTTVGAQPYYAYSVDCAGCTVAYANARYARTFTELGGFTASGTNVGTLTITNTSTGLQSNCTPTQGYGYRVCKLASPLTVYQGQTYTIKSTGIVEIMKMDQSQRLLFPQVGTANGELRAYQPNPAAGTNAKDVPGLWAGPLSVYFPLTTEN